MSFMETARVQRDLSAFADAGTQVTVAGAQFQWLDRGVRVEAEIAPNGGVATRSHEYASYASFLASSEMADLRGVARAIANTITQKENYLDADADAESPSGESTRGSALTLIRDLVAEDPDGRTRLIFVTADAGSGKTTVLRELVRLQAERYLAGEATYLFLYVNAQGRALARFNEAMAVELQDLRTHLTYHAVAPLVREGLVVPVVDGFDELIGTQGGYDDAFSSMSSFLAQLEGQGALVAAARSAYYEQEFLARANRSINSGIDSWSQWPVRLHRWSTDQVREYAANELGSDSELESAVEAAFAPEDVSELRGRPLFVARVVDLVKHRVQLSHGRGLLDSLVESYIEREQGAKLLSRTGRPLLDSDQLREYYTELALEMWHQKTRQLSRSSLRETAELFAGIADLGDDGQRILIERAPTLAFMESAGPTGGIEFEHETFMLYFLSSSFAEFWVADDPGPFAQILSKSDVTDELADYVVLKLAAWDPEWLVEKLQVVAASAILRRQQIAENCGALAVAALRQNPESSGLHLRGFEFAGLDWSRVSARNLEFEDCALRRCDLRGVQLHECSARGLVLEEVQLSAASWIEVSGLDWASAVSGIRWSTTDGATQVIYDPLMLRARLAGVGLPSATEEPGVGVEWAADAEVVEILSELARAYGRANPVCEADRVVAPLLSGPKWKVLHRALIDSGVVTEETRAARGSRKQFFRCQVQPRELMAGQLKSADVDSRVQQLWAILGRS